MQSQAATHESTRGFIELLEILFVVIENLACRDSTESDGVVKDWISMFHGVTLRKRGERGCGPF